MGLMRNKNLEAEYTRILEDLGLAVNVDIDKAKNKEEKKNDKNKKNKEENKEK